MTFHHENVIEDPYAQKMSQAAGLDD